jgi:hypothetical protein
MIEFSEPFTFIFIGNNLLTITLILNQNESEGTSSSSYSNPLENPTWFCLIFQLIFLLLKTKLTDF